MQLRKGQTFICFSFSALTFLQCSERCGHLPCRLARTGPRSSLMGETWQTLQPLGPATLQSCCPNGSSRLRCSPATPPAQGPLRFLWGAPACPTPSPSTQMWCRKIWRGTGLGGSSSSSRRAIEHCPTQVGLVRGWVLESGC